MVCDNALKVISVDREKSLNPYSIGIWSATLKPYVGTLVKVVLILILLEYGLRRMQNSLLNDLLSRLNPYSIGIWSATS